MGRKSEKKMDLLDLPLAERKRLCFEIRAALRERISVANNSSFDEAMAAGKSVRKRLSVKNFDDEERNTPKRTAIPFASVLKKS